MIIIINDIDLCQSDIQRSNDSDNINDEDDM